jgi:hypothetical protein
VPAEHSLPGCEALHKPGAISNAELATGRYPAPLLPKGMTMTTSPMMADVHAHARTSPERLVYNTKQAARLLGISTSALNSWRRFGRGPDFIKFGVLVRYSLADIERWLASNRVVRVEPRPRPRKKPAPAGQNSHP